MFRIVVLLYRRQKIILLFAQGNSVPKPSPSQTGVLLWQIWEPFSTQTKPTISKHLSAICNQEFAALFRGLVSLTRKWFCRQWDLVSIEQIKASDLWPFWASYWTSCGILSTQDMSRHSLYQDVPRVHEVDSITEVFTEKSGPARKW